MKDATGKQIGTVGAEVLVGEKRCKIRQTVFSWTTQKFPFSLESSKVLTIREPYIITVTGVAISLPLQIFNPNPTIL